MPILSVRWMGQYEYAMALCTKYGVPVCGIIRSIRPSGEHTPGEAIAGVVARPADGSSA